MKKSLILLTLLLVVPVAALAQTPSPSATNSGTIRDAVKDQVDKELSNIKQSVDKKAYVGSIANKADLTLTITNLNNQTRTATVTAETTIKLTGGKDGTPTDLKVGNFIIAMGSVDSNGLLTTKRLLVVPPPVADKRVAVFATVTKVSATSLTVTDLKKETWTVKLSKANDAKVGSQLVVVGITSANNTLTASIVSIFPVK